MIYLFIVFILIILLTIWCFDPRVDIVKVKQGYYKVLVWYNKWESGGIYFRRSFFELLKLNFKNN